MASFVVMESPRHDEDPVFVRDGFTVIAFLVPAVWLLWHRMWLEAVAAIVLAAALAGFGSYAGLGNAAPMLSMLVGLLFGLEAASLRVAALRRRGWREWGIVEAETAQDAEIRHAAEAYDGVTEEIRPALVSAPSPLQPALAHGTMPAPVLGLFSYPGRG